jgi:nitrous oxide reductase accessory protein NosL
LLVLLVAACSGAEVETTVSFEPQEPGTAECSVCGMVVAEQPAPRGQVVHRDGKHNFFCSLGDLRAYLQTPTPAGRPEGTWVEVLPPGFDLASRDASPHPWLAADSAVHVVGAQRGGIMGLPILSFADAASAVVPAGARVTTWVALESTPFNELPEETP